MKQLFFLLFAYIKSHWKAIFLFGLINIIFLIVFILYRLPLEAVEYGALLAMSAAVLFVFYDFWKFCKYHFQLAALEKQIKTGLEELPKSTHLIERDYQRLLMALYQEKMKVILETDKRHTELLDYYTLWAHQIKTPISAMGLLLQSDESDKGEMNLELFKIQKYVELVLQYLRMESLSSDMILKQCDFMEIVRQAVKQYSTFFIQKKIKLNLENFHMIVLTDEKWLEFVIEQLLSNALKYTPSGGCITISVLENERKEFIIEDTGIGIQTEDLPRIFERGFTGYNGRMDKKSTGIGLYLCKRILENLSHSIEITSCVGKGTKVKIIFSSKEIFLD